MNHHYHGPWSVMVAVRRSLEMKLIDYGNITQTCRVVSDNCLSLLGGNRSRVVLVNNGRFNASPTALKLAQRRV